MTFASGLSVPRPNAGIISVPKSIVRICMVVSGKGTAPPEKRYTAEGTASGTLEFRIYIMNLRIFA